LFVFCFIFWGFFGFVVSCFFEGLAKQKEVAGSNLLPFKFVWAVVSLENLVKKKRGKIEVSLGEAQGVGAWIGQFCL
jgi:hypothetical protein